MLKIEKIQDKEIAQVMAQADPCKIEGQTERYDCMFDCTVNGSPHYYGGTEY